MHHGKGLQDLQAQDLALISFWTQDCEASVQTTEHIYMFSKAVPRLLAPRICNTCGIQSRPGDHLPSMHRCGIHQQRRPKLVPNPPAPCTACTCSFQSKQADHLLLLHRYDNYQQTLSKLVPNPSVRHIVQGHSLQSRPSDHPPSLCKYVCGLQTLLKLGPNPLEHRIVHVHCTRSRPTDQLMTPHRNVCSWQKLPKHFPNAWAVVSLHESTKDHRGRPPLSANQKCHYNHNSVQSRTADHLPSLRKCENCLQTLPRLVPNPLALCIAHRPAHPLRNRQADRLPLLHKYGSYRQKLLKPVPYLAARSIAFSCSVQSRLADHLLLLRRCDVCQPSQQKLACLKTSASSLLWLGDLARHIVGKQDELEDNSTLRSRRSERTLQFPTETHRSPEEFV